MNASMIRFRTLCFSKRTWLSFLACALATPVLCATTTTTVNAQFGSTLTTVATVAVPTLNPLLLLVLAGPLAVWSTATLGLAARLKTASKLGRA